MIGFLASDQLSFTFVFCFVFTDGDIQPTQVIQEQDDIIRILTHENERLQELLETQVISQHRENDAVKERLDGVQALFLSFFSFVSFLFLLFSFLLFFSK